MHVLQYCFVSVVAYLDLELELGGGYIGFDYCTEFAVEAAAAGIEVDCTSVVEEQVAAVALAWGAVEEGTMIAAAVADSCHCHC